jgi:hypothetical protein
MHTNQDLIDNNCTTNNQYNPKIYIKLKGWHPPPALLDAEELITVFEKCLKAVVATNNNNTCAF